MVQCTYCFKHVRDNDNLKRHVDSVHLKNQVFCEQCDKGFSTIGARTRHMRFSCNSSGELFHKFLLFDIYMHCNANKYTFLFHIASSTLISSSNNDSFEQIQTPVNQNPEPFDSSSALISSNQEKMPSSNIDSVEQIQTPVIPTPEPGDKNYLKIRLYI